jgi:hypothetical protein
LVVGAVEHFKLSILLLSIPAFLLAGACHWLAIRAIDAWRDAIYALVNLGRVKLADSLGLKFPQTLEEEKDMWGVLTPYIYNPSPEYGKKLDVYRKAPLSNALKNVPMSAENGGNGDET